MTKLPIVHSVDSPPIASCPHCGCSYDYYTKDYISGSSVYFYRFDGKEADNGSMYYNLDHKQGKIAYCSDCEKAIFRIEE